MPIRLPPGRTLGNEEMDMKSAAKGVTRMNPGPDGSLARTCTAMVLGAKTTMVCELGMTPELAETPAQSARMVVGT